ncbi:MAG: chemotaxis protein CheB [Fibrobacterota bacterium]|nr:chemotaxis protein CheB [Fibrobacterota bacterium]
MGTLPANFIVGIGGSAGALDAYKALLNVMPPKTGMAFVIISHMNPTAISQLAQILSRHTKMNVIVPNEGMSIQRNHVYVIPPNADLSVVNNAFKIITPRILRNNQVDLFFTSIAEAFGPQAIGIVFSGYDGDGTEGCKQIKAKGGITFAQDDSAEVNHMPLTAQDSGWVDFVLSPGKIPEKLLKLATDFENNGKKAKL